MANTTTNLLLYDVTPHVRINMSDADTIGASLTVCGSPTTAKRFHIWGITTTRFDIKDIDGVAKNFSITSTSVCFQT